MILNAEFHRNMWLEINFTRLITIPLVLVLIFWALFISKDEPGVDIDSMGNHLSGAAMSLFALITVLWGAQLAGNSLIEEAQAQTWDWQRLSAQSPVKLIIGKLFGSTILAWYGGICCLIAYFIFAQSTLQGIRWSWLILAISSAIFTHASVMLLTLITPPEQRPAYQQKRSMSIAKVFMLLLALYGIGLLTVIWTGDHISIVHWYGIDFSLIPFCTWSMVIWASWSVFGCIKRTSTLLRCPTTPAAWLAFVVFCMIYFMGFTPARPSGAAHYYGEIAFLTIFCLLCSIALLESKAPLHLRLWIDALHRKAYPHAWQNTPRWVATFMLSLAVMLIAIPSSSVDLKVLLPVAIFLFVRDMAVLYWFHWTPHPKRPYLAFSIYLLLVYLLLPFLLKPLNWLFYPNPNTPISTLAFFLLEAIVAVAFLLQRWEGYYSAEFVRNEDEEILQSTLVENEKVIYTARVSIGIQAPLFLTGLAIIAVGFIIHFYSPLATVNLLKINVDNALLWIAVLAGLGCWFWAFIKHLIARHNTKLTFTNKRVIVKIGFPLQQNIELPLAKIGSIQVTQTQRGRMFNYGNIIINSIGNPQATVADIANPSEFRRTLMEAQPH